jgi:type IV pilus assembly protein PilA
MKQGFTLIELMVVVIIIGILSALAIPRLTQLSSKSKIAEISGMISTFEKLQASYYSEANVFGTWVQIGLNDPNLDSKFITYDSDLGANIFRATPTLVIGDCATTDPFSTQVNANGSVLRSPPANLACANYLPNF